MLPLAGGLTKLAFNRFTNYLLSGVTGSVETSLLNGIRITTYPADHDGRILYLFGTNDPKVHHVCQSLLRPGDCFLDIGANYASIGLLTSAKVGLSGEVHLFEPQPKLCTIIREAISHSDLKNIHLHEVGLMAHDGQMQLAKPSHHSGMATLLPNFGQRNWETVAVDVKNIATYLPPLIGRKPFGAKVDVEGAESEILPWLLAQPEMQFVVFEAAQNQRVLFDFALQAGCVLFGLKRTFITKQVEHISRFDQMKFYHDLVAVRLPGSASIPDSIGTYKLGKMLRGAP